MPSGRAAAAKQDDAVALTVKCPTCAREKGRTCIGLAVVPGGRVQWVAREPHRERLERARDR